MEKVFGLSRAVSLTVKCTVVCVRYCSEGPSNGLGMARTLEGDGRWVYVTIEMRRKVLSLLNYGS